MSTSVTLAYTADKNNLSSAQRLSLMAAVALGEAATFKLLGLVYPPTSDNTVLNGDGTVTRTLVYAVVNPAILPLVFVERTKSLFQDQLELSLRTRVTSALPVVV